MCSSLMHISLDLINSKMTFSKTLKLSISVLILVSVGGLTSSCVDIPKEGSIAPDVNYRNRKQFAISGMEQTIGDFLPSSSTLPLIFEIVNVTETNNQPVTAFDEPVKVLRYSKPIVGNESEEELRLKADSVLMPALTINRHTGKIEILEGNNIPPGEYHFDVKVSNSSGSRVIKDALIIEFVDYDITSWSSGMARQPIIERVADSPNQIHFVGYLDGTALPGDRIDFVKNRSMGFKGTFVDDTDEGEIWRVNFPVKESDTYCTWKIVSNVDGEEVVTYASENFQFVLGRPGSYVIRLYK